MVQAPTRNIYRIVSESSERPHAQERDITHTTLSVLLRAQRADLEAAPRRSLHKVFKACIPCRRHGLPSGWDSQTAVLMRKDNSRSAHLELLGI
mmetsp:Transcript_39169/g.88988  ORF Transcript_39169/g.88988 Transcript_39169/m.88988 type:complete len:94 (+) Transcript_39169:353-634(+)